MHHVDSRLSITELKVYSRLGTSSTASSLQLLKHWLCFINR